LASAPTAFLRRQADAPIHWQSWTKETTRAALDGKRLIFLFIGSPLYPNSHDCLNVLHNSPEAMALFNRDPIIPVLADAEANRELARLAATLSTEINRPVAFPFLIWLSPEGNPIAWIPVESSRRERFLDLLDQSHAMVMRMWDESADYVISNSHNDAALRAKRLETVPEQTGPPVTSVASIERALRRTVDLFDSTTGEIDGTGGLLPSATLEFLGSAACSPVLDPAMRNQARTIAAGSARSIVLSPMVDPLDGGIYFARRGLGWQMPQFTRDTSTQARAATALLGIWRASKDQIFLDTALAALRFADAGLGTGQKQIIRAVACPRDREAAFLWSTDDLAKALDAKELSLISKAANVRSLGNVPPENDPSRQCFRLNTLGIGKPLPELAAAIGLPEAETSALLASACKKMLQTRSGRLGLLPTEPTLYSRELCRLASAHAAAFAATGDPQQLAKAQQYLTTVRRDFSDPKAGLRQINTDTDACFTTARALDYALAIHAALDLHNITLDPSWRAWAQELVEFAATNCLTPEGRFVELNPAAGAIPLSVTDTAMLFEESSAGLFVGALARMSGFERSAPAALLSALNRFSTNSDLSPVINADLLATESARYLHPVVRLPDTPAVLNAYRPVLQKILPRHVSVVVLPAGNQPTPVTVLTGEKETTVANPEELATLLEPSPPAGS
jgi:uncharacterized protein YyaL (SSP411 family)